MQKKFYALTFLVLLFITGVWIARFSRHSLQSMYRSSSAVYARNGELLRLTLSNDQKYRLWVPLAKISPEIKESFLRSEDRYFFSHFGVNPWSLIRATFSTYFSDARRSGASTITMQLARMVYSINSRHPAGKLAQILAAMKIELLYSKEEILEAYLNLVPMGGNIEGVGAASLIFFRKKSSAIKWAEALTLAVIPQNPTKRTLLAGHTAELKKATLRLFPKISKLIPQEQKSLVDLEITPGKMSDLPFHTPHFIGQVLERSPTLIEIKTTLDLPLQKLLELRLRNYIQAHKYIGVRNAAAVVMNWKTSEVQAWIGSADFHNQAIAGQVDGVTSVRSPGSALKPFIYALATEEGLIHPGTILKDTPKSFGSYDPENFDGEFKGPISSEEALNQSRNLPAVELVTKLKNQDFYQFLIDSGVGIPKNKDYYGYSIALGGFELSLLELVELYALLPNRGEMTKAHITEAEIQSTKNQTHKKLLSPEASFVVLDMLSRAELQSRRFRRLSRLNTIPVSWKTGTSSGFRDAWTIGIFGQYVLGVWLGNFSGEPNQNFVGRELAAPLFFDLMDSIRLQNGINDRAQFAWNPTSNIKKVEICSISGKLPGPHCQHLSKVNFIPGTSPINHCDVHRQIWISKQDGSLSCLPDEKKDTPVIQEYWPSDILEVFAKAGLPRKLPPRFGPTCSSKLSSHSTNGRAPEIISPREDTIYSLRSQQKSAKLIPLQANLDSSASALYWFIDNEFVGKSTSEKAFFWEARSGNFQLKAVDDLGRSSGRKLAVRYVD